MKRVRANATYRYEPVLLDRSDPPVGVKSGLLQPGQVVKVVNLRGCPPANTMGHCHIEDPETREFLGLVCCNSLVSR